MASTAYDYVIVDEFPNDVAEPEVLELEIIGSSPPITSASLEGTSCNGDPQNPTAGTTLRIWFDDPLSAGDETQLDVLVAAHQGVQNKDIDTSSAALATTDKLILQPPNDKTNESIALGRDGSNNMTFQDVVQTTPLTLTQLASGALLPATEVGQMLYSYDGSSFAKARPIVSDKGFVLTSDAGNMIVVET